MDAAHHLVLLACVPGLPSIFAGLFSARFGTPILLVFLAIGILFGKEGPVGFVFNCTQTAYLIGSAALAVTLFVGGSRRSACSKSRCGLRWRWPRLKSRSPPASSAPCSLCSHPPPSPCSTWVAANRGYPLRRPTPQRWPCACTAPGLPFPSGSPRHLRWSPVSMAQCRFF